MGTSSKAIAEQLREVASGQHGFFTAKQAVEAGYADSVHAYHVKNGDWIKMHRGVYRLATQKPPPWPELIVWSMWSRGRDDRPQGVYSGETALAIHGVIEGSGGVLQMTVPSDFRKNCEIPQELKLYKEDLAKSDVEVRDGYLVTTLRKAMEEASVRGTNPKILKEAEGLGGQSASAGGPIHSAKPKKTEGGGSKGQKAVRVVWDEHWDGAVVEPGWSGGKTFEDALNAGED